MSAFRWKSGRLSEEETFLPGENGTSAFGNYLRAGRRSVYFLLIDMVEEDFHFETIPYVRGSGRRTLLTRKLAQRYRDLSFATTISLGHETGARREERILFSSFTNTQPLQPWLAALRSHEARLVGAYSIALLSPPTARRIGFQGKRFLLVSLQGAGLRQTFVDNGQMRFSRLGRVDPGNPEQIAQAIATDSARIEQYLLNTRILARDAGPLDVVVLVPQERLALYRKACADTAELRFHLFDLDRACRRAGLKSAGGGLLAERLFLHVLASTPPAEQYLDDDKRRYYHVWRARETLLSAGAAVGFFCLFFAAMRVLDIYNISGQASADRAEEARYAAIYAKLQARFPKTPTSHENLKALIENYRILVKNSEPPFDLIAKISEALAATPQIDIDRVQWRMGTDLPASAGDGGPRGASAPVPAAPAAKAPGGEQHKAVQIVEISGRVQVTQASDYRGISSVVNQFVRALEAQQGVDVVSTRLPFDINAETSLSGDIGAARSAEVPRFTVVATAGGGT
ncbi:MAG: hypothetical protein IT514_06155 [Burkholderiales bacterium]|nr:hypothetical protein [Burkholderiales bacterium]